MEELSCGEADSLVLTVNTGTAKNAHSLVLMIEYEEFSVIFAGDAQGVTEAQAIANFAGNLKTTVLTASHHGANSVGSNGPKWIEATSPEIVICSAGDRFDHPICFAMDRFTTVAETREHEVRCGQGGRYRTRSTTGAHYVTAATGAIIITSDGRSPVKVHCTDSVECGAEITTETNFGCPYLRFSPSVRVSRCDMNIPRNARGLFRVLLLVAFTSVGCIQEDCDNPFEPSPPPVTYSPTPGAVGVSIVNNATFIAGDRREFHCAVESPVWGLRLGTTVPLGRDDTMVFTGQARPGPAIFLNFTKLDSMPVGAQIFLFAHECGHVNSPEPQSEVAANCWGANILSRQGALTDAQWDDVRKVLVASYPVATGPYPNGEDQWRQIQGCR